MSSEAEVAGGPTALVVGAGPVGLAMAHELTRRGVRVRLVDSRERPARTSRAIATHPRTLEVYDHMGVVDGILERGRRITAFTLFQRGRRLTRLDADYTTMPTRYPFTVAIDQAVTEQVLREALARLGVEVEWGTRLDDFTHDDTGATVQLVRSGAAESVRVPWLVGCDGGHSVIRKKLGLRLIGETSETWLLADAQVATDLPRNSIYWVRTGGITMMMVPMIEPGRWRMLDTAPRAHDATPAVVAERFTRMVSAGIGGTFRLSEPTWVSVFTFQQRMIDRMRVGRCLLAGDAAHVHSPASGQGMNTGIQEAYNLAWKLAAVVHGHADESVLDTYSKERVPVGRLLLDSTKKATRLIQLKNPLIDRLLPVLFAVVRGVPAIRVRMQRGFLGGVSGLNLRYADSPLSLPGDGVRRPGAASGERVTQVAGDPGDGPGWTDLRAELRDVRWTLLVFAGSDPEAAAEARLLAKTYEDRLSVRTVIAQGEAVDWPDPLPADPGLMRALGGRPGDWLLIRPDAYVAARGSGLTGGGLATTLARLPLTDATA
jgi:NADPH-dependent dioxygenase